MDISKYFLLNDGAPLRKKYAQLLGGPDKDISKKHKPAFNI